MASPALFGAEFLINSTTFANQSESSITGLADGRFVVTWTDTSLSGGDTSGNAVRAQIYNADGSTAGAEFLVNSTTLNVQNEPDVTALSDGRFVISWTDNSLSGADTSGTAVRAQIFNGDGSVSGSEFLVNTSVTSNQDRSSITALEGGGFVVSWTDFSKSAGDTSGFAVRVQVYDSDGNTSGAEFLVATTTLNSQSDPTITTLADGRFVVSWQDFSLSGGDTTGFAVRGQIFNPNGTTSGAEFLVNTTTASGQSEPTITALKGGQFVVSWRDDSATGGDTSLNAIRAQVFNSDASKSGSEFLVNTTTNGSQANPSIAGLEDGRFVVSWTDFGGNPGDTSGLAIRAQVFNADGSKAGDEFLVNTAVVGSQQQSSITALADGRFVVSWTDGSASGGDTSGSAVRGQIFDPREAGVDLVGSKLGDDFIGTNFGDVMSGKKGSDTLLGRGGKDVLEGGKSNDLLKGGAGKDHLSGQAGKDMIFGGKGADTLVGGKGNDLLAGGGGNDSLTGGKSTDTMTGGAGADTFFFNAVDDSGTTNATRDEITDFNQAQGDLIDLSAIDAISGGGNQAFTFIGTAGFSGTKGELRFVQTASKTIVHGDVDGDGAKDFSIELDGLIALTAGDFVL